MEFFKQYTLQFLKSEEDDRAKNIILKRNALDGHKKQTLEELGDFYGLSRERIRQIEKKHLEKLKKTMRETNKINKTIKHIGKLFNDERILPKKVVIDSIDTSTKLKEWEIFFFELLDISCCQERNIFYKNEIQKNDLNKIFRNIRLTLKDNTIPMGRKDLYNHINFANLTFTELDTLINTTNIITKKINGETYYQSPIDKSWSAGSLAYLIIWENDKVMTTNEILKEIKERFSIKKQVFNIVNQMCYTKEIQNIDRHTWGLRKWELETKYITHIMERVIRMNNRPMSVKEIVCEIKKKKSNVKAKSVEAYTHLDSYIRLSNGKVILYEWKDLYI